MEEKRLGHHLKRRLIVLKWLIMLLIGICTGLIAVFVAFSVKSLTKFKFSYVQDKLDSCLAEHCLFNPYLTWIGINMSLVIIAALLILWEVNIFQSNQSINLFILNSQLHVVQVFLKLDVILMV
jgi:hypothetical protein